MDWEAFERDVWENVNDSMFTEQWGSLDNSDPKGGYTGIVVTIGETWAGTLYGTVETANNGRVYRMFETEGGQRGWFEFVVGK